MSKQITEAITKQLKLHEYISNLLTFKALEPPSGWSCTSMFINPSKLSEISFDCLTSLLSFARPETFTVAVYPQCLTITTPSVEESWVEIYVYSYWILILTPLK